MCVDSSNVKKESSEMAGNDIKHSENVQSMIYPKGNKFSQRVLLWEVYKLGG